MAVILASCDAFPSTKGQFPYLVGVTVDHDGPRIEACHGVLISNQWILTTAQCVYKYEAAVVHLGTSNNRHNISQSVAMENIFVHPKYGNLLTRNDIALMKIEPVQFSETVQPVKFPENCDSNERINVTAIGHGNEYENIGFGSLCPLYVRMGLSKDRRNATLTTIPNSECRKHYPLLNFRLHSVICAKKIDDRSGCPCVTLKGSPIVRKSDVLVGLTSFDPEKGCKGCESNKPVVFTNILPYMGWISEVTGLQLPKC